MSANRHQDRLAAIRQTIRTARVGTQEELRQALRGAGFNVTQATLSRDLAKLQARRVSLPEGGSAYELDDFKITGDTDELARMSALIVGVEDNGTLVVLQTVAGAAAAVAAVLDRGRLPQILGTIAGDDTIFIAPARRASAHELAKQLKQLWRQGKP